MAERLDKRLVLCEWMFGQLGYTDTDAGMRHVAEILRDEPVGWDEQNVFHFRRRRAAPPSPPSLLSLINA